MKKLLIIIFCIMFAASLQAKTSKDIKTTNNKKTNKKNSHDSNKGWYLGGGIGLITNNPTIFMSYPDHNSLPDYEMNVDKSITLNGGYTFNSWFALEGELNNGFVNKDSNSRTYNGNRVDSYYDNQFNSVYLNTVFKYTFKKKHTPFIKLGLGYANYKHSSDSSIQIGDENQRTPYHNNNSYKDLGTHFAIGYEYSIASNKSVIISYDMYKLLEDRIFNPNDTEIDINKLNYIVPNYTVEHKEIKIQYKYSFK